MSSYKENAEYVKKILDGDDWHYDMQDHGTVMTFTGGIGGFKGIYKSFQFVLFVGDDEAQSFASYPVFAKEKLPETAEFITRVNYGLKFGQFQMDYEDGEVRFHLAFPMTAVRADELTLPTLLALPAHMLDQFSKGYMEVLMGVKSPEEAIKDCMAA